MDRVFLRVVVRQGHRVLADDIAGYLPSQPLADCLPASVTGIHRPSLTVSLHPADALTLTSGGTRTAATTPVAVCQQFGLPTVLFELPEPHLGPPPVPRRTQTLVEAVLADDLAAVQELCAEAEAGAQLEALHTAIADGRTAIVAELLQQGVPPAAEDGVPAVVSAAISGRAEIIRLLAVARADITGCDAEHHRTALGWAVLHGHRDAVQVLLELGVPIEGWDAGGDTALTTAVVQHDADIVTALLGCKADVNAPRRDGQTPLMLSTGQGDLPTTQLLVRHGAALNVVSADGSAALTLAAQGGHRSVVDWLLAQGARPVESGPGVSELLAAAERETALHRVCGGCGDPGHSSDACQTPG